ncbi:hypothetical protein DFH06DRAFT_1321117 [Mycena polygramma]|nr:hypothetical protein DFH06DRAFT_1321117 [Mycena polygramma]
MFRLESTLGLGVVELGIFATLVLLGILVLQVYVYYICNSDRAFVKILVAVIFTLEMCHTGFTVQAVYYWTITLGSTQDKPGTVSGLSFAMVFETLITFSGYYIHRVYQFSRNAWVGVLLCGMCLLRLTGGIALSVWTLLNLPHEPDYFSLQNRVGWLVTATLTIGASVDVSIAASLCLYVYSWKTAPTMKTTSQLINRIMFWSIQTGLVTSLVSVAVVVCFQTMKQNYVWIGIFAVLGKLYSNSLLASLNIRSLHRKLDDRTLNSFALFSEDYVDETGGANTDVEFAGNSSMRCAEDCACGANTTAATPVASAASISTNATHSTLPFNTDTTSSCPSEDIQLKL